MARFHSRTVPSPEALASSLPSGLNATARTPFRAVLTVTSARPAGPAELECQGTLEAAGHVRPVTFTAHIQEATGQAAVLTAELEVDRTHFDMTWSPLHIASMRARGTVTARFVRA